MQEFTQLEINKGIEKLRKNQKNKLFFTYYSYAYFLRSYLKKKCYNVNVLPRIAKAMNAKEETGTRISKYSLGRSDAYVNCNW